MDLTTDEKYMRRCVELALNAEGETSPNPLVGSVIVREGRIMGEGFHAEAGAPHAEVNAVNAVPDQKSLEGATLYVNLEPCSHRGKTPPCADLIVKKKIARVVIGTEDPHKKVSGKGIAKLKKAGIEVKVGVLPELCERVNAPFFTFHRLNRPHIVLKWAQSPDGFIDLTRSTSRSTPALISGEFTQIITHRLRAKYDAIMVGTKTAALDNPSLDARLWNGNRPIRVVLDNHLMLSEKLKLMADGEKTIIFNSARSEVKGNLNYIKIPFDRNLIPHVLRALYRLEVQSLFVEGGAMLLQSFIDSGLWDEVYRYTGTRSLLSGVKAPEFSGALTGRFSVKDDVIEYFRNPRQIEAE